MVGVTRATLYEHMKDKKISVIDKDTSRPKINVSELQMISQQRNKPEIGIWLPPLKMPLSKKSFR